MQALLEQLLRFWGFGRFSNYVPPVPSGSLIHIFRLFLARKLRTTLPHPTVYLHVPIGHVRHAGIAYRVNTALVPGVTGPKILGRP